MTTPQRTTPPVLELPADTRPAYANLARIAHSPADIVIDFAHLMPGESRARITSRVLMSPLSAKLLLRALTDVDGVPRLDRREPARNGPNGVPPTQSHAPDGR